MKPSESIKKRAEELFDVVDVETELTTKEHLKSLSITVTAIAEYLDEQALKECKGCDLCQTRQK